MLVLILNFIRKSGGVDVRGKARHDWEVVIQEAPWDTRKANESCWQNSDRESNVS
jgi:hypothetical protein